jgi:subtilisin-like proprotein convertase family protein
MLRRSSWCNRLVRVSTHCAEFLGAGRTRFERKGFACAHVIVVCLSGLASPMVIAARIESFDLRLSHEKSEIQALERLRQQSPAALARAEAANKAMHQARRRLEDGTTGMNLRLTDELGSAEIVAPGVSQRVLTKASHLPRETVARNFLVEHASLYGLAKTQAAALTMDASYANPAGNLEWVRYTQSVNGLPVFRGEVTVALTPQHEVVRTSGQLAGFIEPSEAARTPRFSAIDAVRAQLAVMGLATPSNNVVERSRAKDGRRVLIDAGVDNPAIEAKLLYFPLGKGVLELAWCFTLEDEPDVWYHIVSATDGRLLFRKNLTDFDPHTYRVYTGASPAPFIPGPTDPTLGEQAPRVFATDISVDSQSLSGDPWLDMGVTVTDGNNVEAGLDRDGSNGVDAPVAESGANEFLHASNPAPGDPAPGDDPLTPDSQRAGVINLFYWANRFHDLTYDLGFTEAARNFQHNNYGRGGVEGDRISAESQDSIGSNNANFVTPPDGGRGRLQTFLWTGPTPDRDGALDAEIVLHELTHGLSGRLHADATGLSRHMSRGLAQGWSDFYAAAILSSPTDPITATRSIGGYSTHLAGAGYTSNYYYGVQRFPKAVMAATGGPGNLPFDPLTFADIDPSQINLSDGAYPRGLFGTPQADHTHNIGEVWASILWEARGELVAQQGAEQGNQRMLQIVTDGMKLDPVNPTFLDARDSILAANCAAYAGEDELALWAGFARRGLGVSARIVSVDPPVRVVEAFDSPIGGSLAVDSVSNLSCSVSPRNPAPGETVSLQVQLSNQFCATPLEDVVVRIPGDSSVSVGTLAPAATTTVSIPYTIPLSTSCGSIETVPLEVVSQGGTQTFSHALQIGVNSQDSAEFSNANAIDLPAGQPGVSVGVANPYPSTISVSGFDPIATPVSGIEIVLTGLSHPFPGDIDVLLQAPDGRTMVILSDAWADADAVDVTVTLSDAAPALAPAANTPLNVTESVRPTNHGAADVFDAPAPAPPYATAAPIGTATFADFAGIDPNGDWKLYVRDDFNGDAGLISGGWTLRLLFNRPPACEACLLTLGGTVTGLAAGNTVSLRNHAGSPLPISGDGSFTFPGNVEPGQAYNVVVSQQPTTEPQFCAVANGSGTVGADNIANIAVTCGANQFSIGGQASGLLAGESVQLQLNGGETLSVAANGPFIFTGQLMMGGAYDVSIAASALEPERICRLFQASGTVPNGNVTNVALECVPMQVFADGFE